MRIDARQHAIDHARFRYRWLEGPSDPLRKDYAPEHAERILRRNRFDAMVLVAAQESVAETLWLLDLASRDPFVLAVVGWVDLEDPDLGGALDELIGRSGKLRGICAKAGAGGMAQALPELARRGLVLELDARPDDAEAAARLAGRAPDLPIVVSGLDGRAAESLAAAPNVSLKISGVVPRAGYARDMLRVFGPKRLLFGSDWPYCLRAVDSWKKVLAAFTQSLGAQAMEVRSRILGENALDLYGRREPGPTLPDTR